MRQDAPNVTYAVRRHTPKGDIVWPTIGGVLEMLEPAELILSVRGIEPDTLRQVIEDAGGVIGIPPRALRPARYADAAIRALSQPTPQAPQSKAG